MKDLKTLLSSDATDFERELLGAVANERPSPELQLRMQQALGIAPLTVGAPGSNLGTPEGVGTPELSGTHSAVKAGASKWASGTFLKAALGLGVGAGLVVGGVALSSRAPEQVAPATTQVQASPAEAVSKAQEPEQKVVAPEVAVQPVPVEMSRELREEIELLDRVRTSLAQGNASGALALLGEYQSRFPGGKLAREAGVLRARATQVSQPQRR